MVHQLAKSQEVTLECYFLQDLYILSYEESAHLKRLANKNLFSIYCPCGISIPMSSLKKGILCELKECVLF